MITILIIIYLIGCVLAYGRETAYWYGWHESQMQEMPDDYPYYDSHIKWSIPKSLVVCTFLSLIGFAIGSYLYHEECDKYFFKWSYRKLRK